MKKFKNVRWLLVLYDIIILMAVDLVLLVFYKGITDLTTVGVLQQSALTFVCVFSARFVGSVYRQIWRYGGIQCYIRLLFVDGFAFLVNLFLENVLPIERVAFSRLLAVACMNLLGALTIRMMYRYAYKCGISTMKYGKLFKILLRIFAGERINCRTDDEPHKIKIAIIGAGRVGVALAEELLNNRSSAYTPRCFVDSDKDKSGRDIHGIPVLIEDKSIFDNLKDRGIQEVVFALPSDDSNIKRLYELYQKEGYKIKVYDYPLMQSAGKKRHLRDFDVEELLFRKPVVMTDEKTTAYYKDKVILITGGGGSIGSELCRQLAKMEPKTIIILDIYENGAYDVQQELRIAYGAKLDLRVEIGSITNKRYMNRIFAKYNPQVVINAAAHKHVPLMEDNSIEAVENNVFGTQILIELCEQYETERFMMVSTDKAVNPTNVMGATKRLCEMLVQSAATWGRVKYSATRFGNVLGSAGSVIPLFKKQIASGGPITITDKRIIRYFMTIPEASQLVLQSGAMAKNGELFVLDMGQPVKILDLAENMIKLSGVSGIEILETGLRPGEKLYEELLVKTEELAKTENKLIFIERDAPVSRDLMNEKMELLKAACNTDSNDEVKAALLKTVPTYKPPKEVNSKADQSSEMQKVLEVKA